MGPRWLRYKYPFLADKSTFKKEIAGMQISQFFMNGDIKGAIAYMREHEEFQDVLPAHIAVFENGEYRS